jgi:hypothetical protein
MRALKLVLFTLLFPVVGQAQTSCSADVPKEICKVVTTAMFPLDHQILKGTSIPVELVTADEYQKRFNAYQEEGNKNDKEIIFPICDKDGMNTPRCVAVREKYFAGMPVVGYTHSRVMLNHLFEGVTFLRDRPVSTHPDRILLSTEACLGLGKQLPPDKNGIVRFAPGDFEVEATFRTATFIIGFIAGAFASTFD